MLGIQGSRYPDYCQLPAVRLSGVGVLDVFAVLGARANRELDRG